MSFIHDRRGQSVVIGTVILFGFLIVALAVYQAQVVPQENAQVEFEHSQEVENDVNDLRNAILRAGSTGSAQSQRVRLGTRYPQRTFFVNPPPATGQLSTTDPEPIQFENAEIDDGAHENVGLFWDTSPEFQTRSIQYTPDYNEFREAPTLTYEHSVVAAEFDDEVLFRSGQSTLRENRISLTTVSGEVSENGVEARSVDVDPISQGTRGVPITGDDIEIVLPTAIGNEDRAAERWAQRLPDDADVVAGTGTITLRLPDSDDPYRLRLSNVSVDGTGDTEPAYIVPVGPETVAPNGEIGVEVRDEYNNPVAGADVTIDGDDGFTTDDDGRVFTTVGAEDTVVRLGTPEGPDADDRPDYESVQFEVRSEAEETRTFRTEWTTSEPATVAAGGSRDLTVRTTDRETGDPIVDSTVDASYAVVDAEGDGPDTIEADERTDPDGRTTVEFDASNAEEGDQFRVYASSGDDVDRLLVDVIEPDALGFNQVTASDLDANTDGQTQEFTFQVSGDLPEGETVDIDLDDAQQRGDGGGQNFQVDYRSATGSSDDGDVTVSATNTEANVEFTSPEGGVEDGETAVITVENVATGPNGQQTDPYTVTFTRNDSGASEETTFEVD